MAQYKTGTVTVTLGSATVTGSGVDFSSLSSGDLFVVVGRTAVYQIASIASPVLTLTTTYAEASGSARNYCVTTDFTPNFQIPLMYAGDIETATIFTKAMSRIDNWMNRQTVYSQLTSITRSGTTATATLANHALFTGQIITVAGATPTEYNGSYEVTVLTKDTFTYQVAGSPATPATGTILASYRTALSVGPTFYKAGHSFIVGTALCWADGDWQIAYAGGGAKYAYVVGIVTSVSGSSFTIKTEGMISGLTNFGALAAGSVLYLTQTQISANLTDAEPGAGLNKVPLAVVNAYSSPSGVATLSILVINFPIGETAVFTGATTLAAGVSGAVPAPAAGSATRSLRADGTWVETSDLLPPGMVAPFATATAPTGWLVCDGTAVSRTTYQALYDVVGIIHGYGDATSTFNLPDYRGRFLRGLDTTGTVDTDVASRTAANTGGVTGANVGSVQADALKAHTHGSQLWQAPGGGTTALQSAGGSTDGYGNSGAVNSPNSGTETRPKNAAVLYCIKY